MLVGKRGWVSTVRSNEQRGRIREKERERDSETAKGFSRELLKVKVSKRVERRIQRFFSHLGVLHW